MIRFEGPWLYWVECQGGKWAYGVRSWGDLSVGSAEEARKQAETLVWLERHKAP
jgi:hypothetical protein